jgi:hypothetical protein
MVTLKPEPYHITPTLSSPTDTFGGKDTKTMLREMELCRTACRNYALKSDSYHIMPTLASHTYTIGGKDTKTMLSEMELCRATYRNYVSQREGTPIYIPAKSPDYIWGQHMLDLHIFKQRNGHCRVPRHYNDNPKLGRWVMNVRSHFQFIRKGKKSSLITEERLQQLQDVDFDFAPKNNSHTNYYADRWVFHLQELYQFKEKNGHCRVPQRCKVNKRLGGWVVYVRHQSRRHQNGQPSRMTPERIEQLKQLDFDFYPPKGRPFSRITVTAPEL